jgi:urocanate hydratase
MTRTLTMEDVEAGLAGGVLRDADAGYDPAIDKADRSDCQRP